VISPSSSLGFSLGFAVFFADAFCVFTLSLTLRFDCHTASFAFAMPSMVRRLTTERGFSSRMSGSSGPRAASSLDLISSHGSCRSPGACACAPDASGP
jgi:hypothetical protein